MSSFSEFSAHLNGIVSEICSVNWDRLLEVEYYSLFKSFKGEPISFFVLTRAEEEGQNYRGLIEKCGGWVEEKEKISNSTVVLLKGVQVVEDRFCFNASYITDCVKEGVLLNIDSYLLSRPLNCDKQVNFMDVLYWQKSVFPSGERNRRLPPQSGSSVFSDSDDSFSLSDSCPVVLNRKRSKASERPKLGKNTRDLFSRGEEEDMLKYIVRTRSYSRLKSNSLYWDMEKHGVCPKRTFHSMRNHITKHITATKLETFQFLKSEEKEKLLKFILKDNRSRPEHSTSYPKL